jgi:hypothetical protein
VSKQTNPGLEAFSEAREAISKGRFYAGIAGLALGCNVDTYGSASNPGKPEQTKGGEHRMASRDDVVDEARNVLDGYVEIGVMTGDQADAVYERVQDLASEYEDAEQAIDDIVEGVVEVDESGYEHALDTMEGIEDEIGGALERGNRTLQTAAARLGLNGGDNGDDEDEE